MTPVNVDTTIVFDNKLNEMINEFVKIIDTFNINIHGPYGKDKTPIPQETSDRIGKIIRCMNYYQIHKMDKVRAKLDTIEYLSQHEWICNIPRDNYCKLIFYLDNSIDDIQGVSFGKHVATIYITFENLVSRGLKVGQYYDVRSNKTNNNWELI